MSELNGIRIVFSSIEFLGAKWISSSDPTNLKILSKLIKFWNLINSQNLIKSWNLILSLNFIKTWNLIESWNLIKP